MRNFLQSLISFLLFTFIYVLAFLALWGLVVLGMPLWLAVIVGVLACYPIGEFSRLAGRVILPTA